MACKKHGVYADGCFACKVSTINLSASATPTKKKGVLDIERKEKNLSSDMRAYKALRKQGLQPRQIDGSAEVEAKATNRESVEMGHFYSNRQIKNAHETIERLAELG